MSVRKKKTGGWFVYILKCSDGSLYTGITNNLTRRVKQHNDGTASRYTRSRLPVRMLYKESSRSRSCALKKEFAIKSLTRKKKKEYIKLNHGSGAQALG